jgi:hypothetical protein
MVVTWLAVLLAGVPRAGHAQGSAQPEILVLGTYHMASSGNHVFNVEMDNVLSDTRQREIAELVEVLQRFRPTKVAVEAGVRSRVIARRYASYLAGDYTLTANEIDQVGLRLAMAMDHETVYTVDEDGDFPYYRVLNYAKANDRKAEFDSIAAITGARVEAEAEFQRTHTILETLELMNSDSAADEAVGQYYAGYLSFGDPFDYAGPDLIASWFQRNIRIYRNIRALATSPDDRILVIYGAGHLGWLRQMVQNDPGVRLRKLSELSGPRM